MSGTYHSAFIALSILIGVLASYVALDLAGRVTATRGRSQLAWVAGGALAMGVGMWSLHFVGMLAFRLDLGPANVPIGYDVRRMLLSLMVAVAGWGVALVVVGWYVVSARALGIAGLAVGAAIAGTHYLAMAAMHVSARLSYTRPLVLASTAIAVGAAYAALCLASRLRDDDAAHRIRRRLGAAIVMGVAIAGMHYTAMAAARFSPTGGAMRVEDADVLATDGLAAIVVAAALVILSLALLTLALDRRSKAQLRLAEEYARLFREAEAARAEAEAARQTLEESERRFRTMADTAPVLMWMCGVDRRCEWFNRSWLNFTGRTLEEELDNGWAESVHQDDRQRCLDVYVSSFHARQPFTLEYRRRADGEYRWVLDTGVPRYTPSGEFAGYIGSCIDITERKRAEEAQHFLLEAARVLASSLDLEATLGHVTSLLVPRLADYCFLYFREEDGSYRQVASAHVDPEKAPLLEELGRLYELDLSNPQCEVAQVLKGREPVLSQTTSYEEARLILRNPEALRIYQELSPVSYMIIPLTVRAELLGTAVLAASVSGRHYGAQDLALAEVFVARAALAMDNARLYTEARRAHDQAIRAARLESQLTQARLQALRAQLNPHFLFNALNTIAMLVRRQANTDALRGVVSLSELLRRALASRNAAETPLREELALVERYLAIEQLRFRDRLRVSMTAAPETLDALVPSFILQPLVENAIRHGIARHGGAGLVGVVAQREDSLLTLVVRDDGPGFPAGWSTATSGGVGLSNTRERLQRLYGTACHFEAQNAPEGGALLCVKIPFRTTPTAKPT